MKNKKRHLSEEERLQALYSYEILDSASDPAFDELVELASDIAGMPISLISLVDKNRQWFKARLGLPASETPLEESFCAHAIAAETETMMVSDATKDDRFMYNKLVTGDPGIRFYAGFPLITDNGAKLGTLCIIDKKPNSLSPHQQRLLQRLSRQAMKLIELHLSNKRLEELRKKEVLQTRQLRTLLTNQKHIMTILAHDTRGPMYSITQALNVMEEGKMPAEVCAKMYPLVKEQSTNVIQIIEGLIDWGKMQMKKTKQPSMPYPLHPLVRDILQPFYFSAHAKSIRLDFCVEDVHMQIHPEVLKFVIRNLVGNALKYTEEGNVSVNGVKKEDKYEITVVDTGTGMSEKVRKSLFQAKMLSQEGTRLEKGSGLGFVLISNALHEMNCEIQVDSKPNKGTAIRILIPATYYSAQAS